MSVVDTLIASLRATCDSFPDVRTGSNLTFKNMADFGMDAFSVFHTQNASFLERQRLLAEGHGVSNCNTLYGMAAIPTDNHIRTMLDPVDTKLLDPVFGTVLGTLTSHGVMDQFQCLGGHTLVALDGTEYHASYKVHCANCSHRLTGSSKDKPGSGTIQYFHTMVSPVLVGLGHDNVVPLPPEFIVPQDGHEKQDCEPVAAIRWLGARAGEMAPLRPLYLGDDIYSRQPLCQAVLAAGADFLFTAKETTHKLIYEYVSGAADMPSLTEVTGIGAKARRWEYRWLNKVPLRDGSDALTVDFVEVRVFGPKGRQTYHNSWVTSLGVTRSNVAEVATAGRARWKTENGNFNVLKTKGYNLEHNFGHGKKNLSSVFACMNLLAFAMHTVCLMLDDKWQRALKVQGSRKNFFNMLRAAVWFFVFPSWDALLAKLTCARSPPRA